MFCPKANKCFVTTITRNFHKEFVRVVEVGPRDGLQNEPTLVPTSQKVEFINKLSETGLKNIEVTSFVSPKWVPQMGDNSEVYKKINKKPSISYPVLVPNLKGLEGALALGVKEIAVFASASEKFARKNTNCSKEEGIKRIEEVITATKKFDKDIKIRGYVSCIVGCPYEGYIKPNAVTPVCEALLKLGCYEISLGDTIGVATRLTLEKMLRDLMLITTVDKLAIHCHDTYGQALVNIVTCLEHGIRVVDSSVSGLGGCPYAAGATGNVATEDLVYMVEGMGGTTGVDLKKIIDVGHYISHVIKKPTASRVNRAMYEKLFKK